MSRKAILGALVISVALLTSGKARGSCVTTGNNCATNEDCCSGNCGPTSLCLESCGGVNVSCSADQDCCTGLVCNAGFCSLPPPTCEISLVPSTAPTPSMGVGADWHSLLYGGATAYKLSWSASNATSATVRVSNPQSPPGTTGLSSAALVSQLLTGEAVIQPKVSLVFTLEASGPGGQCSKEPFLCGNAAPNPGEECDDGFLKNSNTAPNACRTDCRKAHCGDGVLDAGESCDDGNISNGDGCNYQCQKEAPKKFPWFQ
jgi:cysteine-rich repeat protein